MKDEQGDARLACLHAQVKGLVQGVGFRAFVLQTAISLGLRGWVRNRWDGSVEVLAEGKQDDLESFLAALWRGPRSSRVLEVAVDWQPALNEFNQFFVRKTD